jgi:hypothetical protein
MNHEACRCYVDLLDEARSNAVEHAYTILADAAGLGRGDTPPLSVLAGALALLRFTIDDRFEGAEQAALLAALVRLEKTTLQLIELSRVDGASHERH